MQVAFTVVLFAGAALMVQQLRLLERRPLGFSTAGIVTAQLTPSLASHPRGPARAAFIARIVDEIASSGDVESAAAMTMNPLGGATWAVPIVAEGAAAGGTPLNVAHQLITPGLLRTLGIPLVSGRDVTRDDTAGRTRVAIVSTALAAKLWPGHSPLGSRLRIAIDGAPLVTVVGVVGDVPPAPGSDLPQAAWYLSYAQMAATRAADDVHLMVRVKGSAASAGPSIAAAVHRVDGEAALYGVRTLDDYRASTLQADRLGARLMAAVGIFAIALIAVGVYGVLAFSVAARRTELSIRGALGATAANLRGLVLRDSLKVTGAGLAIGGAGAAIVTRALAALLPQAGGSRLSALLLSAFVVLMVSMLAALVPAVRAGRLVEQRPE
jgi:hypothetical protein